jgi:hypothetical protein
MSRFAIRLVLLAALAIGAAAISPPAADAGPIKAHLKQKMLDKPAKKPKPPPPPKKEKKHSLKGHFKK